MGLPCVISHQLSVYEQQQYQAERIEAAISMRAEEIKAAIKAGSKYSVSRTWEMSPADVLEEINDEHHGISAVCALLLQGKLSDATAGMQLRFMLNAALNKIATEAAQHMINEEVSNARD